MHHAQLGEHALEATVLFLQVLDLLELAGVHAAILRLPVVEGGYADRVLPTDFGHLRSTIMLLEHGDDLMFCELALPHGYWVLNVAPDRQTHFSGPRTGEVGQLQ